MSVMPDPIKFPIVYQCRTEGCPNENRTWELRKSDVTFRTGLVGLIHEPHVLCDGCATEPANITEDKEVE